MKNSLAQEEGVSVQISRGLSGILADTYVLYVKTQNFHWNIVDPRFYSLHALFEVQYRDLAEKIDELAERIRILKIQAPGSMKDFLELATLRESEGELNGLEMVDALMLDRESLARQIRSRIEEIGKLGDEGTSDLYIQHLKDHEKAAWILRSHQGT